MTTAAPTSTAAVAEELVSFCRAGRNIDAINALYSPDIVSVESMGNAQMPAESRGLDAIRRKNEWWPPTTRSLYTVRDGKVVREQFFYKTS